ncbi:MAG: DHH family phosphoesterase [Chloroflexota bacterium]
MTVDLSSYVEVVPDAVIERLRGARHVLAIGHEHPDADTLGATIGIGRIVACLGGRADLACADPPPPLYDFLPGIETVRTDVDPKAGYDLIVLSDTASLDRAGAIRQRAPEVFDSVPRVIIDHHASNDATGPGDWIDPAAAATCEMVALLACRLGIPLDEGGGALATALIGGMVMDTATFAHPNTTPRTLAVAAALVEAGAPLTEVSRLIYRSKPASQLRLFGRVLDRLEESAGGRVIWSTLRDSDLDATGAEPAFSEGIIDLLAQADTADIAILFKEMGKVTRLSVRTRPGGVDATVLTGRFGGGGHARAAGATVQLPVDDARPAVLAEAERLLSERAR